MNKIRRAVQNYKDKSGRERAAIFIYLPSKLQYPDYYDLIKKPVSLYYMKRRTFSSPSQFYKYFLTLFANAKTYNRPKSPVHQDASVLEVILDVHG